MAESDQGNFFLPEGEEEETPNSVYSDEDERVLFNRVFGDGLIQRRLEGKEAEVQNFKNDLRIYLFRLVARKKISQELRGLLNLGDDGIDLDEYADTVIALAEQILPTKDFKFLVKDLRILLERSDVFDYVKLFDNFNKGCGYEDERAFQYFMARLEAGLHSNGLLIMDDTRNEELGRKFEELGVSGSVAEFEKMGVDAFFDKYVDVFIIEGLNTDVSQTMMEFLLNQKWLILSSLFWLFIVTNVVPDEFRIPVFGLGIAWHVYYYLGVDIKYVNPKKVVYDLLREPLGLFLNNYGDDVATISRYIDLKLANVFKIEGDEFDSPERSLLDIREALDGILGISRITLPEVEEEDIVEDEEVEVFVDREAEFKVEV